MPVTITAELGGYIGHSSVGSQFSVDGDDVKGSSWASPYSSVNVTGDVGLGWHALANQSIVYSSVSARLIRGSMTLGGVGSGRKDKVCFKSRLNDVKTLDGEITATAQISIPVYTQAVEFVDMVCDNGYVSIPGCSSVQRTVNRFSHWTKTRYTRKIAGWDGYTLVEKHYLLDNCITSTKL